MFELKGPRKNKFRILGARIWVSFVRSGGAKTGGIAGSFEDFGAPGADEDGLKPGCIEVELIFARALRAPLGLDICCGTGAVLMALAFR